MKKLLTITILALCPLGGAIFAQNNTLPTTGNVGIGTLNPSSKLDVNGHVRIDSTLLIKDSILIQKDARVLEDLKVEGQFYLPNISFANGLTNTEILVRGGNGQIVKAPILSLGEIIYDLATCEYDVNGVVANPMWSNGPNKIYTACPDVFVGIGNFAPKVNLDVSGAVSGTRLALGVSDPENSTAQFHLKVPGSANNTVFLVENNQRELFQINNDGIVRAREIIINLDNPWPDYVFSTSYSLQPLHAVEKYIKENGHLPNVPSARTVEEEGLSIGEMNKILLEKVEELTLHLIAQEKRIQELEIKLKKN
jgi:hypothetical protein